MYWEKEKNQCWYSYELEPGDKDFLENPKRLTNSLANIYTTHRKNNFKLHLGGIEGSLIFKRLKNAKEFTEKTIEWEIKVV